MTVKIVYEIIKLSCNSRDNSCVIKSIVKFIFSPVTSLSSYKETIQNIINITQLLTIATFPIIFTTQKPLAVRTNKKKRNICSAPSVVATIKADRLYFTRHQ